MLGLTNVASSEGRVLSTEVFFSVYVVERNSDCSYVIHRYRVIARNGTGLNVRAWYRYIRGNQSGVVDIVIGVRAGRFAV